MSARHLSPRVIRRALGVVDQLPAEALADLIEALVNKLDAAEDTDADVGDDDLPVLSWAGSCANGIGDEDDAEEDNVDRCPAADDDPKAWLNHGFSGPGEPDDAEDSGDCEADHDAEPDASGAPRWVIGAELFSTGAAR